MKMFTVIFLSAFLFVSFVSASERHHDHNNTNETVVNNYTTVNNYNDTYVENYSTCGTLGIAFNHPFGSNTKSLQWSVNGAKCGDESAVSGGLAKKFDKILLHGSFGKDERNSAFSFGVSGKF